MRFSTTTAAEDYVPPAHLGSSPTQPADCEAADCEAAGCIQSLTPKDTALTALPSAPLAAVDIEICFCVNLLLQKLHCRFW